MQNTEFTCPQRRNEFWQTMYKPSLCTSLCWKSALYKMSKNIEKKIVRKTTYVSKGPEGTLRNMWSHKNSHVCKHMPRETERILQDVELWPNSIRESQLGRTRIYMDKQYIQRIKEISCMMLSRHRRIIPLLKRSSRRCTYVDSWSLPSNSIIRNMPKTIHEFVWRGFNNVASFPLYL